MGNTHIKRGLTTLQLLYLIADLFRGWWVLQKMFNNILGSRQLSHSSTPFSAVNRGVSCLVKFKNDLFKNMDRFN